MWPPEVSKIPRRVAPTRLQPALDELLPRKSNVPKISCRNGFVVYEMNKALTVESDQLDMLREMARRSRQRYQVGRAIKFVAAIVAILSLCLLELAIRNL